MSEHAAGQPAPTTAALVERQVHALLTLSPAYKRSSPDAQRQISSAMITIGAYLAEPEDFRANHLRGAVATLPAAGLRGFLEEVNFPEFVGALIQGVFHAIVDASIEQMQAYADLLNSVAKTVDQFVQDNVSDADGRDWLATTYPEYFERDSNCGVLRLRTGLDHAEAIRRLDLLFERPLRSLGPDDIEKRLVPAARRRLAVGRQQLLASMVLMGVNRLVVKGGTTGS